MMKYLPLVGLIVGAVLVLLMVFSAIFAGVLSGYDPIELSVEERLTPPSQRHPFGTDNLGRDIFSRIVYAFRVDLRVSALAVLISLIVGGIIGAVAGLVGGVVYKAVIYAARFIAAGPGILFAIAVVSIYYGTVSAIIGIAVLLIPGFIRVVSGLVLCLKNDSANKDGSLPSALLAILGRVSLSMALAMLVYAGFSFIGLGAHPPTPELGAIISEGRMYLRNAVHVAMYPGIALLISALSFNILGESLNAIAVRDVE